MAYPVVKAVPVVAAPVVVTPVVATPVVEIKEIVKPTTEIYQRTLKLGAKGSDVRQLQAYVGVKQTGVYDSATKKAVQIYQKAHDILPANGLVGKVTLEALNSQAP